MAATETAPEEKEKKKTKVGEENKKDNGQEKGPAEGAAARKIVIKGKKAEIERIKTELYDIKRKLVQSVKQNAQRKRMYLNM